MTTDPKLIPDPPKLIPTPAPARQLIPTDALGRPLASDGVAQLGDPAQQEIPQPR
jgi:hypothetical protein